MSTLLGEMTVNGKKIQVVQGDLTQETGAIVNPANSELQHLGGAALAIARAGGRPIVDESAQWVKDRGRVPTGATAVTTGGSLPAKFVIHAVGPIWGRHNGEEARLLGRVVYECLLQAELCRVNSVSIPAISSGIFGGDKVECCQLIQNEVELTFFRASDYFNFLQRVRLIANDVETAQAFLAALK